MPLIFLVFGPVALLLALLFIPLFFGGVSALAVIGPSLLGTFVLQGASAVFAGGWSRRMPLPLAFFAAFFGGTVFMAVAGICALSRDPLSDNAAMVIAIVVGGSLWAGLTRGAAPGIFKPGFGGFLAAYLASAVTFAAMAPLIWFEIKHPREFREALSFSASHTPPQEIPCCADAPWSSKCRLCLGRTPSSPVR